MTTSQTTYGAFPMGRIVATAGVMRYVEDGGIDPLELSRALWRHQHGDWGDVDDEDKATNDQALIDGNRLLSAYTLGNEKVWIITEWDRSVTTVLFPSEY